MIDLEWPGVLIIDGNISLATAVNLTAGGGQAHPIEHAFVDNTESSCAGFYGIACTQGSFGQVW